MTVRVGVLDTGIAALPAAASGHFVAADAPPPSAGQHGDRLATIIRHHAPACTLLDARAFVAGQPTAPARIAAAIDWLIDHDAQLINMSFGLPHDRPPLAAAIARAAAAGILCVASAPAAGGAVYPASYPSCVAVSGDARCDSGTVSLLHDAPAWHFGAANGGPQHRAHQRGSGASYAAAHISGALAQLLIDGVGDPLNALADSCRWRGRECRR